MSIKKPNLAKEEKISTYQPEEYLYFAGIIALAALALLGICFRVSSYLYKKRQEAMNQCYSYGYDDHEFIDGKCYQVERLGYIPKENCAKIIYPTAYERGKCYILIKKIKTGQHTR